MMDRNREDTRICLVRWIEGMTRELLVERDGKEYHPGEFDPIRRLSFCGPLSRTEPMRGDPLFRTLGFPRGEIGTLLFFRSMEEARQEAQEDGSWIAVDVPMPLSALQFSTIDYFHYDGSTTVLYDGGDYIMALGELKYRMGQVGDDPRHAVKIRCRPRLELLGELYRPTSEQAACMNANALAIRERLSAGKTAEGEDGSSRS